MDKVDSYDAARIFANDVAEASTILVQKLKNKEIQPPQAQSIMQYKKLFRREGLLFLFVIKTI